MSTRALQTFRPKLSVADLRLRGINLNTIKDYYVFQTPSETVAAESAIEAQGITNPGHTLGVCLMKGAPWGANYGRYNVLLETSEIVAQVRQAPEYVTYESIPPDKGVYVDYDTLVEAGIARKRPT